MRGIVFILASVVIMKSSEASAPPKIRLLDIPETSVGSETTLLCSLGSGTRPVKFTWSKDGQDVDPNLVIHHEKKVYSTIFINSVKLEDRGRYTCRVESSFGEDSKSGDLVINGKSCTCFSYWLQLINFYIAFLETAPVSWKIEPQDIRGSSGQRIEIRCEAEGIPEPTVTVSKKSSSQLSPLVVNEVFRGTMSAVVRLDRLSSNDSGSYSCQAWNDGGKIEKDFTVYVSGQFFKCRHVMQTWRVQNYKFDISFWWGLSILDIMTVEELHPKVDEVFPQKGCCFRSCSWRTPWSRHSCSTRLLFVRTFRDFRANWIVDLLNCDFCRVTTFFQKWCSCHSLY